MSGDPMASQTIGEPVSQARLAANPTETMPLVSPQPIIISE